MRYSKEFKLECIKKHKAGAHIEEPGGCKRSTFMNTVRLWVRIFDSLGEAGLEHGKPALGLEDKLAAIARIEGGESVNSVAVSLGRQEALLSKWHEQYLQGGVDGLKSMSRRGRPPKVKKDQKKDQKKDEGTVNQEEQLKRLQRENEILKIENEYLKKLAALVQARKGQQRRKK